MSKSQCSNAVSVVPVSFKQQLLLHLQDQAVQELDPEDEDTKNL
jgi:hypothetical protein